MNHRHDDDDGYDDLDNDRHNDNDECDENYDDVLVIGAVWVWEKSYVHRAEQYEEGGDNVHQHLDKRVWHHKKFCQTQIKIWKRRIKKAPPSMGN